MFPFDNCFVSLLVVMPWHFHVPAGHPQKISALSASVYWMSMAGWLVWRDSLRVIVRLSREASLVGGGSNTVPALLSMGKISPYAAEYAPHMMSSKRSVLVSTSGS